MKNKETSPETVSSVKPIDMHVHIVGNGTGGTGCVLRSQGWRWPLVALMLRHMGLPLDALRGDLDRLYAEKLLVFVRQSSLGTVVILAHDHVRDDRGRIIEKFCSLYAPNDYVFRLARSHPEFLPGISIHPSRPDAMEELERGLEGGAVLLKCLPNSQNIDCADPRHTRFWERMAGAGLPLLVHTGGEHTVPVIRPDLADPRRLERPLECGVTVIAAHSATRSGLFDRDYFDIFVEMARKHPRLYGDLSAFNIPIRGRRIPECLRSPLVERMIHGSDFPVPVFGHWSWFRGFVDWRTFRKWEAHPNPLERDYQLKRAMGFPPETFTRIASIMRRPTNRKPCQNNQLTAGDKPPPHTLIIHETDPSCQTLETA